MLTCLWLLMQLILLALSLSRICFDKRTAAKIATTATMTISSIMLKARICRRMIRVFKRFLRWVFLRGKCVVPFRDASRQNDCVVVSNRNAVEVG